MNFYQFLLYINKISFIFFIIVFIFLIYQLYFFKKKLNLKKEKKIFIPDFNQNIRNNINYTPLLNKEEKENIQFSKKKSSIFIIFILILITFFMFLFIIFQINLNLKDKKDIVKNNTYLLLSPSPTFLINKDFLPKQKNITPMLTLVPTISLLSSNKEIFLSKITISPTGIFYYLKNNKEKIDKLPISGAINKNFLILTPGIILILFSLFF